jgi:hypothetical protein
MCSIDLTHDVARHIAGHLRWTWQREVAANLPGQGTPAELDAWAGRMVDMASFHPGVHLCIATPDGEPAVMGGIVQVAPHIGSTWLAGTDRVGEVAVEFMRDVLRRHRQMQARGVRRFVASVLDGPDELFSWLVKLGYQLEGRHPGQGLHGDAFLTFGKVV